MKNSIIATASSNNFYPWLLNFLGSIGANYPNHPPVIVYDLGMRESYIKELKSIKNVTIIKVPAFVPHWKSCYAWKLWILNNTPAKYTYYIDAASEVLLPLTEIFNFIKRDGYFVVEQCPPLKDIVPPDLLKRLNINENFYEIYGNYKYFAGGNIGYKKDTPYHDCLKHALKLAEEGWTLGFSSQEKHRDAGQNRCEITRDCKLFRHDQTLLNVLFYQKFGKIKIHGVLKYGGWESRNAHPKQIIYNSRKNNRDLKYIKNIKYTNKPILYIVINRSIMALEKYYNYVHCSIRGLVKKFLK